MDCNQESSEQSRMIQISLTIHNPQSALYNVEFQPLVDSACGTATFFWTGISTMRSFHGTPEKCEQWNEGKRVASFCMRPHSPLTCLLDQIKHSNQLTTFAWQFDADVEAAKNGHLKSNEKHTLRQNRKRQLLTKG